MKKLIAALTLFIGLSANANLITLEVSETDIAIGESVEVSIFANNFDAFDTFDFDLEFDTSLFDYQPATLTSDLFAALPLFFEGNAIASGSGVAFSYFEPLGHAGGDFLLANFTLTALSNGSSEFSVTNSLFADTFFFTELTVDTSATSEVEVNASQVPGPATIGILSIGLFVMMRRRFKR